MGSGRIRREGHRALLPSTADSGRAAGTRRRAGRGVAARTSGRAGPRPDGTESRRWTAGRRVKPGRLDDGSKGRDAMNALKYMIGPFFDIEREPRRAIPGFPSWYIGFGFYWFSLKFFKRWEPDITYGSGRLCAWT